MTSIRLQTKILETNKQIENKIVDGVRDHLNLKFPLMIFDMRAIAQKLLYDAIINQPEYIALRNGDLKVELGLVDGQSRLLSIIDIWLGGVKVDFKPFRRSGARLTGGITITAIRDDYRDVIEDTEANFLTEKGENLPWLRWLLLEGTTVIIADYSFHAQLGIGRTRGGVMINKGSWRVPAEYSGIQNENFVTRAIGELEPLLETELTKIVESKI